MQEKPLQAVAFDLDGTLTQSKSILMPDMASLLCKLLEHKKVLIMSGGNLEQFETQFLSNLSCSTLWSNLYLMPTSGAQFFTWNTSTSSWEKIYSNELSESEKQHITSAFTESLQELGLNNLKTHGDQLQDRGSQLSFSALGQLAPLSEKILWDPTAEIRKKIVSLLLPKLPEFNIGIGGTTTIDVTKKGIDKAYGIQQFIHYLKITPSEILFIGDALFENGNDAVVKKTGIQTLGTTGPEETMTLIQNILNQI